MAVLTLAEAKTHLNITSAINDAELQTFIDAATAAAIKRVREIESTAGQTYRARGGGRGLVLPTGQAIISVQSVTEVGGALIDMSLLKVRTASGVIEYDLGGVFTARSYDVVYTAGYSVTPADLKHGVKDLVRHLWMTQRGISRPGAADEQLPTATYTLSNRVRELFAPYRRTPVA